MSKTDLQKDPIFVVGHPKSGTSLLVSLLDSHEEVLVLPEETDFYSRVWPRIELLKLAWQNSHVEKVRQLVDFILKDTHINNYLRGKVNEDISGNFDYSNLDTDSLSSRLYEELSNIDIFNTREVLIGIVRAIESIIPNTSSSNYKYWLEKTPKHTFRMEKIVEDFPESKFIFIHRDPRDNFASYNTKYDKSYNPLQFCKAWNNAFERIDSIPQEKRLIVSYTDLVIQQAEVIESIRSFLRIKESDILFKPSKFGVEWTGNSMFNSKSNAVHKDSLGRYKRLLNQDMILTIETFCDAYMSELGYEFDTDAQSRARHRAQQEHIFKTEQNLMLSSKVSQLKAKIKVLFLGRIINKQIIKSPSQI